MSDRSRISNLLCALFFSLSIALGYPVLAQTQNLDAITRIGSKPIRVAIESSNTQYQALGQQAMKLHGAFEVATANSTDWVLKFEIDEGRAQYNAVTRDGTSTKSRGTVSAETDYRAFRRALDAVVKDFTGNIGFFEGTIAFVAEPSGKPEVYISDILFRSVIPVTNFKNNIVSPRWSPEGERLIYTSYAQTGFPDILVQDLDKNILDTVANYRGVNLGGRFRPDGRAIAFVASSSGSPEIYIARPDGSGARRQTWTKGLAATPSWSPQGDKIVFVSDDWGGPQLILLDPVKKSSSRIRTGMGGYNVEPAWNPRNVDLVAFTARIGSEFQLALYSFSDAKSVPLTQERGSSVEPAWLSDGRHLAFTYRFQGKKQLKVLDTQTGRIENLHSPQLPNASQADYVGVFR